MRGFKKLSALSLAVLALALASCGEADIVIDGGSGFENTEKEYAFSAVVNISSGTFHLGADCRYAKTIKDENRKIIKYDDAAVLIEDGYTPCSYCASEYKSNNGGTDG